MMSLDEFLANNADFLSYPIEGIAVQGNTPFACPIITHVEGNLWQGGTPADVPGATLPAFFEYVLNLYPWGVYASGPRTEIRVSKLYDSGSIPDADHLEALAAWVNEKRALGPTLVHCQAGLNRSALVTGLALVRAGRTPDEAIALLREKRSPAVLCNQAFERWLRRQ